MADLKEFAEQLVNLTVKEVNELAEILKEEYGIEPAAAAAVVELTLLLKLSKKQYLKTRLKHLNLS